jgi:hypothetical protein
MNLNNYQYLTSCKAKIISIQIAEVLKFISIDIPVETGIDKHIKWKGQKMVIKLICQFFISTNFIHCFAKISTYC